MSARQPIDALPPTLEQQSKAIRRAVAILDEIYPAWIEEGRATQYERDVHLLWLHAGWNTLENVGKGIVR